MITPHSTTPHSNAIGKRHSKRWVNPAQMDLFGLAEPESETTDPPEEQTEHTDPSAPRPELTGKQSAQDGLQCVHQRDQDTPAKPPVFTKYLKAWAGRFKILDQIQTIEIENWLEPDQQGLAATDKSLLDLPETEFCLDRLFLACTLAQVRAGFDLSNWVRSTWAWRVQNDYSSLLTIYLTGQQQVIFGENEGRSAYCARVKNHLEAYRRDIRFEIARRVIARSDLPSTQTFATQVLRVLFDRAGGQAAINEAFADPHRSAKNKVEFQEFVRDLQDDEELLAWARASYEALDQCLTQAWVPTLKLNTLLTVCAQGRLAEVV